MKNKLAKLKYLPNKFEILEEGDHVICAVSGKKISLDKLNYWNVDLQEPYFSYKEASDKFEGIVLKIKFYFQRLCDHIHCSGFFNYLIFNPYI